VIALLRNIEPGNSLPLINMMPAGRRKLYQIELPKRVSKHLDKIPNRDYPSILKPFNPSKKPLVPQGARNCWNLSIASVLVIIASSIGLMTKRKPLSSPKWKGEKKEPIKTCKPRSLIP
jgi:hypothetical protein